MLDLGEAESASALEEAPPAPPPVERPERRPAPPVPEEDEEPPRAFEKPLSSPAKPIPPPPDDAPSHFEREPPFRPRRNRLKLLTYAGAIFAVVAAGLIVAVSYFGLPDWVPVNRPVFAVGQQNLELDFPADRQERRQLPNGIEFFAASGTITNVGGAAEDVPPILIVLRDARDRIVYSSEVYPPRRTLAPGEAMTINAAVTDVPRAARVAEIGWKPE